ncbi:MAG: iron-sulfur cluster assembly scaffold protein [Verrucomicrobiota bacterium]|jgi:NifU-like protein involved in Fe-S cluster formation|nr:iron-sulfur cluster assembly scaffold protein [Verrucomicrobiota bacterium]MDP7047960.1 iron-sulfur cluster assembly scaffold protein [Verrucomicrobiota bacterium]
MNDELQKKLADAIRDPKNIGEMPDADSVGTVGNSECGEMLRMWVKYKEQDGEKIIDKASFQSFGCETAIAVASLATELIQGKTADQAMELKPEELSGELGPLPPMKIHCAELVQGALRSALSPEDEASRQTEPSTEQTRLSPTLQDSLNEGQAQSGGSLKINFLDEENISENA